MLFAVFATTVYFYVYLTREPHGKFQTLWEISDHPKEFLILHYFTYFGNKWGEGNGHFKSCHYKNCRFTNQRSNIGRSTAVIFHVAKLGKQSPPERHRSQKWMAWTYESPTSYRIPPAWISLFNSTITYSRRSSVWMPYRTFSKKPAGRPVQGNKSTISTKTKMVAWLVSNCNTSSNREVYVKELQKYIDIDVYGKCGDLNRTKAVQGNIRKMFEQNYKFYLAFENSLCEDYVTEKLFETLNYYIVPVVMAGADLENLAPPNSYIDVRNFPHPEKLANFLFEVASNETKYLSYFEWKDTHSVVWTNLMCDLCKYISENWNKTEVLNMDEFWSRDLHCMSGEKFLKEHLKTSAQ